MSDPTASVAGRPAPTASRRAEAAIVLTLVTLVFWVELVLVEGERTGWLGSLRGILLALASDLPEVVQTVVCVGAPFAALGLALLSLRDGRGGRRTTGVAIVASAVLVALVVLAAFRR